MGHIVHICGENERDIRTCSEGVTSFVSVVETRANGVTRTCSKRVTSCISHVLNESREHVLNESREHVLNESRYSYLWQENAQQALAAVNARVSAIQSEILGCVCVRAV